MAQQTIDILQQCTVDGLLIRLPAIQLDRKLYQEVAKQLELIGGKWKGGKTQGFLFKEDPSDYLAKLCLGESINLKKEFQFFATPDDVADRLVELACIEPGQIILEPSAGQGAIIKAIHRAHPDVEVDCYELMDLNRSFLEKLDNVTIVGQDFIKEEKTIIYDRIIANPPFSKNQDIEHVSEMYNRLEEGGRLVSIMSNHWRFASGKKEEAFKKFVEDTGAEVYDIEPGAFKESGTNISACIVVIDRIVDIEPEKMKNCKSNQSGTKKLSTVLKEAKNDFERAFNDFTYKHGQSTAFIDFLDYTLLAMKWWEPDRDFSYFEKKYGELYPRFADMLISLSEVSDNAGEGFTDALGDIFMVLVSGGRNGQFFTPENICGMISEMVIPEVEDNKSILDPACGSGRMLLAAAKRNRNAFFFGCDNDITCCKMAVINLVLNTLQGEIALMDSLNMEYTKSWEVSYRVFNGINMPVYRVVENKDQSTLWKMHMNSFNRNDAELPEEAVPAEPVMPIPEPPVIIPSRKRSSKKQSNALQLELF